MTRALSIRQPWAGLIAHGLKDVENRTWGTPVRGRILIHAGLQPDRDAWKALACGLHPVTGEPLVVDLSTEAFRMGGIIGDVLLTDCVRQSRSRWFVGPWGFVLSDGQTMPFRPCLGALGFFLPDFSDVPPARFTRMPGTLLL